MRYLGGKSRTATAIVAAINEHAFRHGTPTRWVEPFMGGGSVMVAASPRATTPTRRLAGTLQLQNG